MSGVIGKEVGTSLEYVTRAAVGNAMYRVRSRSVDYSDEVGTYFVIRSPVECPRTINGFKGACGGMIEIDMVVWPIIGVHMNMPATPISIGEEIGVLVSRDDVRKEDA